ncbi:MAG: DUF2127 domain-containing protein [Candidatus Acidiferrum sp.]
MSDHTHPRGLMLIAAFKLLKGLTLLAVGFGALHLINKDLDVVMEHWISFFRVDQNNHFIHGLIERFTNLDDRKLRQLSVGTFFYSAMLLTEGVGLALHQRWAEYFTIIATSSFIPLELYEIFKHITLMKVALLFVNVAVVAYLAMELKRCSKVKIHQ